MHFDLLFTRDSAGKIIRPAPYQSWLTSGTVARVEPNRKWFGECKFYFECFQLSRLTRYPNLLL